MSLAEIALWIGALQLAVAIVLPVGLYLSYQLVRELREELRDVSGTTARAGAVQVVARVSSAAVRRTAPLVRALRETASHSSWHVAREAGRRTS